MKPSISYKALSKALWGGAIAASIATLSFALPVAAQTDTVPGPDTTVVEEDDDDGSDWGLLGLLGLIGLAGLTRKSEDRTQRHDPTVTTSTGRSDYTNLR